MNDIFIDPFFVAFWGWLAFNLIMLRITKDSDDDKSIDFHLKEYVKKSWDNWLTSLVCVPIVLYLGYKQLNIGLVDFDHPKIFDLYYLGAGFLPELIIVAFKKWRSKNQ